MKKILTGVFFLVVSANVCLSDVTTSIERSSIEVDEGIAYRVSQYPSGKIYSKTPVNKDGNSIGAEYRWKEDGSLAFIISYVDGKIVSMISFYPNGKCSGFKNYNKDGKLDGPWITFYPTGLIQHYSFCQNGVVGKLTNFDDKGIEK
jgi:antitoxin component YwqK of YwqJK toxin-antitoxin module